MQGNFSDMESLVLELKNPDFVTATRILDAINAYGRGNTRPVSPSSAITGRSYCLGRRSVAPVRFIAEIGELLVEPDTPARVIVDERTGTVVIGRNVQISTVAVTHGNLTVRITEAPIVSQPSPFSRRGETVVMPQTFIDVNEQGANVAILRGTDLQRLVRGSEPDRAEADRGYRHPAGDQGGGRAASRSRHPVGCARQRRASLVRATLAQVIHERRRMASFATLSRNVLLLGCVALFGQAPALAQPEQKPAKPLNLARICQIVRGYRVPRHVPNPKRLPPIRSQSRP